MVFLLEFLCLYNNICMNTYARNVAATSFFIHRTEIFDFVVRWDKKVYRRQDGKWWGKFGNLFCEYGCENYFWFWVRYFISAALLVIIHISRTQKWAAPFPRSNTKSKISFSRGWAQEGLRRTVALQCVCEWIQLWNLSAWVKFARGMFWFYILCAQRCW